MSIPKRTVMTLISDLNCPRCHATRIVLGEKGVAVDIKTTKDPQVAEHLAEINPYNTLPTLIDRDLVLYQERVIIEYLDERFPHPPLLPVYPVARAKSRLMMFRIDHDWYSKYDTITNGNEEEAEQARQALTDSLIALTPVFNNTPYFLSNDFTLVDCIIAPLLWRLPQMKIQLPKSTKSIFQYIKRISERETFRASLTDQEREIY